MDGVIQHHLSGHPAAPPPSLTPASMPVITLQQLQQAPFANRLERLELRMLLCHALSLSRTGLITQDQRQITPNELVHIESLIARREHGEPMAYIIGEREFYGLAFHVTPAVLIPRPETELLVELALERLPANTATPPRLLDMGTGSGALAVALAHTRPDAQVSALDASHAALAIATHNAIRHHTTVQFIHSDWYQALPQDAKFDLIVANPPYIVAGDPHLHQGDLRFEPVDALTDHADGLSSLRQIISGAPQHLQFGAWLLMEHGYDQAAKVRQLLAQQPFAQIQSWCDLAGIERVSGGQLLAAMPSAIGGTHGL